MALDNSGLDADFLTLELVEAGLTDVPVLQRAVEGEQGPGQAGQPEGLGVPGAQVGRRHHHLVARRPRHRVLQGQGRVARHRRAGQARPRHVRLDAVKVKASVNALGSEVIVSNVRYVMLSQGPVYTWHEQFGVCILVYVA